MDLITLQELLSHNFDYTIEQNSSEYVKEKAPEGKDCLLLYTTIIFSNNKYKFSIYITATQYTNQKLFCINNKNINVNTHSRLKNDELKIYFSFIQSSPQIKRKSNRKIRDYADTDLVNQSFANFVISNFEIEKILNDALSVAKNIT